MKKTSESPAPKAELKKGNPTDENATTAETTRADCEEKQEEAEAEAPRGKGGSRKQKRRRQTSLKIPVKVMQMMYEHLSPELRSEYLAAIFHFGLDSSLPTDPHIKFFIHLIREAPDEKLSFEY